MIKTKKAKKQKTDKKYKFYSDSGHGWLAVKRKELVDLGIIDKISAYSYQRGLTVYLEEDCDAGLFINASKWTKTDFSDKIIEKYHDGYSPIRSYEPFNA